MARRRTTGGRYTPPKTTTGLQHSKAARPTFTYDGEKNLQALLHAPVESLPLMAVLGAMSLTADHQKFHASSCVDSCLMLSYALEALDIESKLICCSVDIHLNTGKTVSHFPDQPVWHGEHNDLFNGHTILVIAEANRMIDPTVQQFPEMKTVNNGTSPIIGRWPKGTSFDEHPAIGIQRSGHTLVYQPRPPHEQNRWQNPRLQQVEADHRNSGTEFAIRGLEMIRIVERLDELTSGPYTRIAEIAAAIETAELIEDGTVPPRWMLNGTPTSIDQL